MKQILLSVLAVSFLTAMGPRRPEIPDSQDEKVDELFDEFKALAEGFGTFLKKDNILFSFENFFWGSTAGICYFRSRGANEIELSSSHWKRGSDTFKEMLMFHELGHCALGRGHKNRSHSEGRPESLMNSWLFNQRTYQTHRDQYLKELFTAPTQVRGIHSVGHTGDCTFGHD